MAAHPNVKIKITVLENEAFKSKLTTTMQGGKPPDMFQSWGGGTLKEQADAGLDQGRHRAHASRGSATLNQAAVGLYQIDDKQYGVPFNLGMVGVWYSKSLFEKAGIDAPPATWSEFLADVAEAQGRPGSRRSPSARRTSGRGCSGGPTSRCGSPARTR